VWNETAPAAGTLPSTSGASVGENGVMKRRVEESAGGAAVGVGVGVTAATVMSVMTTRRLRTDRLRVEGGGGDGRRIWVGFL
jgi:hypothetical protein